MVQLLFIEMHFVTLISKIKDGRNIGMGSLHSSKSNVFKI
jgi:hypothetical protein